MDSNPKKVSQKTVPPVSKKKKSRSKPVAVDGVERARIRRLERAGWKTDYCAFLGSKLDIGPRSNRWMRPRIIGDDVVCELAVVIIEAEVSPVELARAVVVVRKRSQEIDHELS